MLPSTPHRVEASELRFPGDHGTPRVRKPRVRLDRLFGRRLNDHVQTRAHVHPTESTSAGRSSRASGTPERSAE